MKTYLKIIALLCLLCLMLTASAQCPQGDVVLLSQQDVGEFGALYPDCTELEGKLQIGLIDLIGENYTDINDLSPFGSITYIAGDLIIGKNDSSMTLLGLSSLESIGGSLQTYRYILLSDFTGLENLQSIGDNLFLQENHDFTDFSGLEGLTTIGGNLQITGKYSPLNSLSGLENLTTIGQDFIARDCSLPNGFSDLTNLSTIGRNLDISYSDVGEAPNFVNLSSIGSNIYIQYSEINSLTGLENLTSFGPGTIQLTNNDSLTDISAIGQVPFSGLSIIGNSILSECNIENICDHLEQGVIVEMYDNAEGCNSSIEDLWYDCELECPPIDLILSSQEAVNNFGAIFPNCTEFLGNVRIAPDNSAPSGTITDITDLSPLNTLTYIGGNLFIRRNPISMTLSGLSNLDSIGGYLSVSVPTLEGLSDLHSIGGSFYANVGNFQGLDNLTSISGRLEVGEDSPAENFIGLESLTFIGGNLSIDENTNIINFVGLENLTHIGGGFYIDDEGNSQVTSFSGLENLSTIEESVSWEELSIADFTGLNSLSTIGGTMYLYGLNINDFSDLTSLSTIGYGIQIWSCGMTSLSGLESITDFGNAPPPSGFIPGGILLIDNPLLTDISAISHLPIGSLNITDNNSLSQCNIESVCEHLLQDSAIPATIDNNAENCNSTEEVIENCASTLEYTIQGNVYLDTNTDCLQDTSETDLDDWLIKIEEDNQLPRYAYTFGGGDYIALADSGAQYTITAIPPNMLWDNICPTSEIVSISADNPHDGVNFGANGSTLCPLLEVDVTAPFVRRCFDSNYYIRYCNSGTAIAENAYVEVQLDPFFTYQNSTIEGVDLGENLYSFDLENIEIGECGNFRIDVLVDCDSTVIGQTHCVEAHIFPDSICTPAIPLWDGSSIKVDAQCLGDSIEFKIENIGTGDMSDSLEYIIVVEDLIFQRANFQLDNGESETFYEQANGLFHRLEAEQSPGHPGNSMPSVFVEGCGENDNGEISVGFVNYYLLDEGDAFVSIDCQENVGSYDPNDKQAFPVGYGAPHYITNNTDLEYMIRFQNTGTDTAFNIVIRDAISPHLNIETLHPGTSSHPYRYDIEESNIAVFHFENIMLPDSNVNEAASHGFIKFNIQQKENNSIGTHIMNDADIYFDFNEPIITNTVYHTVGEDFRGFVTSIITPPQVSEAGISVNVFPNPFDEYARFEVQGETVKELHLRVYDMMGREVLQQKAQHQQHITIKRNNLTPGVYVFRLMDEKQQLATGKLVVK